MGILDSNQTWMIPKGTLGPPYDLRIQLARLGFAIIDEQSDETHYAVKPPVCWRLMTTDFETNLPTSKRTLSFVLGINGLVEAIIYRATQPRDEDLIQLVGPIQD
ncbi:MAG: hypothetical protein PHH01_01795 [Patescibacteria group bacterium]|nr:hypothetical protein [Patescibacteria group bacterium]